MNYDQILDQIKAIESWLIALGRNPSNTRLAKYKKDVATLADPEKAKNLLNHFTGPELRELFFTLVEVSELHSVFSALNSRNDSILKNRFVEVLAGPASSAAEKQGNSGNRPRNLQFELFVMAQLASAGFPIADTTLSDVQTTWKGRTLFFECKRPQSLTSIHACIKDGVSQLRKCSRDGSPRPLAILAVSLTKAMTEGRLTLSPANPRAAFEMVSKAVHQHIEPHMRYFCKQAADSVTGILVHTCMTTLPPAPAPMSIAAVGAQIFFNNPHISQDDLASIESWYGEYKRLERLPVE